MSHSSIVFLIAGFRKGRSSRQHNLHDLSFSDIIIVMTSIQGHFDFFVSGLLDDRSNNLKQFGKKRSDGYSSTDLTSSLCEKMYGILDKKALKHQGFFQVTGVTTFYFYSRNFLQP